MSSFEGERERERVFQIKCLLQVQSWEVDVTYIQLFPCFLGIELIRGWSLGRGV